MRTQGNTDNGHCQPRFTDTGYLHTVWEGEFFSSLSVSTSQNFTRGRQ